MGIHKLQHIAEGMLADNRIGIEQQDVFTARLADGDVVGAGKPQVMIAVDEMNGRETG